MSVLVVSPSTGLRGRVGVPGDKSISHRAVILGAIAEGTTTIEGFLRAEDTLNTAHALQAMGVQIEGLDSGTIVVHGVGTAGLKAPAGPLDLGNSGTGMRLLMGVLAGQGFITTLTGDASLCRRPMDRIAAPLSRMGILVQGQGERCTPPVTVCGGHPKPATYHSPVASAQVKSAVLLAGLHAEGLTEIREPSMSRDHTERMLAGFGARVACGQAEDGYFAEVMGPSTLTAQALKVPGDFSSAAFPMAAALLCPDSEVTLTRVGLNPTRTGMLIALSEAGLKPQIPVQEVTGGEAMGDLMVATGAARGGMVIGPALVPALIDELPLLAVVATQLEGTTVVYGAQELRVKESDRIALMVSGLRGMGAQIEERSDGMVIEGRTPLHGAAVDTRMDHRVAMSFAIAGLVAEGVTTVHGAECIATSFPDFVPLMRNLGADMEVLAG